MSSGGIRSGSSGSNRSGGGSGGSSGEDSCGLYLVVLDGGSVFEGYDFIHGVQVCHGHVVLLLVLR